ncbi:Phytase-like domain-containing protein [Mycena chlorophos]|uniref:Phytase-like domain-containing protein n=1 Tax=Mycena chlorophos TaxID=658473 RepID=A0A8H6WAT8_MYCCL|nr:Phytase-like domain-containing protein [Mycena chlorophos]
MLPPTGTLLLSLLAPLSYAAVAPPFRREAAVTPVADAPLPAVSATLGGVTYVNHGLIAFGLIPNNATESTGDTIGGIGSAIGFKPGTWKALDNGSYTGILVVQPDRGYNIIGTIDYQARRHEIEFMLTPYQGTENLTFTDAQQTLQLTYLNTTLLFERNDSKTSGLDPQVVRPAQPGFGASNPLADPEMPVARKDELHLTLDSEGIIVNPDGTFWLSDEYGPYIYLFTGDGHIIQTIQPPPAVLPIVNGAVNFSATNDPDTGRQANQGFEGLTMDFTTNTLYAMLQSATVQDGALQYTRLFAYDVSEPSVSVPLIGEWVVPLPLNSGRSNVEASSEIHFVSPGVFLSLSRDGNGHGGSGTKIKYKQADLFSLASATNIANSQYDAPDTPVAPKGKLAKTVTPATYVGFVDYADPAGLARFGMHVGDPDDQMLINAKWESLALAPVGSSAPDDYFLFTASDNDFLTEDGIALGEPYNAGENVDNQFFVFRVTLPGASEGVNLALGL